VRCLGLAPAGDSGVTTNYLPNYARAFDSSSRLEKLAIVVDHSMDADGHPQSAYCRGAQYKYARFGIPAVAFSTGRRTRTTARPPMSRRLRAHGLHHEARVRRDPDVREHESPSVRRRRSRIRTTHAFSEEIVDGSWMFKSSKTAGRTRSNHGSSWSSGERCSFRLPPRLPVRRCLMRAQTGDERERRSLDW